MTAVILSTLQLGLEIQRAVKPLELIQSRLVDLALLLVIVILLFMGKRGVLALTVFVRQSIVLVRLYISTQAGQQRLSIILAQPAKLLALSFLAIIMCGTIFLTFPQATTDNEGASIIDAAFTATSATCVTGLAVMNTNNDLASNPRLGSFSAFGQVVILVLIQIGGLGIMTLSAAIVLLLGRRLALRSEAVLRNVMDGESQQDIEQSIRYIFKMTVVAETIGAIILFFRFWPTFGEADVAAYYAVFHSVSAYCNAGFSLWSNSLTGLRADPVAMFTIMGLITVGGLGPIVVAALCQWDNLKRSPSATWAQFPVHAKVVLLVSTILVLSGTVIFYFFEYEYSLKGMPLSEQLMSALFQSVTMRTAGFNTVDLGELHRVTLIVTLLLMFVGGSSGSTAGGVKTSTIAVVLMGVKSMLSGRDDVEVNGRTIPQSIVYKSISILVIFMGILVVGFTALLIVEPQKPFEALLFETVSALATVGVSMGITPDLSVSGKLLITFLMFVGRLGPLTLALAVGEQSARVALRYPEGKIMVG